MALINCSECGREVSDKATACPQCGAPVSIPVVVPASLASVRQRFVAPATDSPPRPRRNGVRWSTLVLVLVIACVGYFGYRVLNEDPAVFNERIGLHEGQAKDYVFALSETRRVEVTVEASPKPVNVYLMNDEEVAAYTKARSKNGMNFTFRGEMSAGNVLQMQRSASLPAGNWHVVIERPRESRLFGEDTSVSVRVARY